MTTGRGGMRHVELEDEATEPVPAPVPRPAARRSRSRLTVALASVVVLLLAVGAAAQSVVAQRERERAAAVAGQPGVASVPDSLEVRWEYEQPGWGLEEPFVVTPDGLVVEVVERPGTARVEATDAATGEEAWSADLLDLGGPSDTAWSYVEGACLVPDTAGRVVCHAQEDRSSLAPEGVTPEVTTTSRVVVLDTSDGGLVTELDPLGGRGPALSVTVVGDLVVGGVLVGAVRHVGAVHLDGTPAWERTETVTRSATEPQTDVPVRVWLDGLGDLVGVGASRGTGTGTEIVLLAAEDGTEVRRVPQEDGMQATVERTGVERLVLAHPTPVRDDTRVVLGADPADDAVLDGAMVPVTADDGSVPGLVLSVPVNGVLRAWVPGGGWAESQLAWQAILLDGRLHLESPAGLVTLDATTGEELWRVTPSPQGLFTDGTLLYTTRVEDGRRTLVGLLPSTGEEARRVPLPPGVETVQTVQGLLVGVPAPGNDDGTRQVLGPAGG